MWSCAKAPLSQSRLSTLRQKVSSYNGHYPLHWQKCSIEHHIGFSGKHPSTLQLIREDYSYTIYIKLQVSVDRARYFHVLLIELEQVNKRAVVRYDSTHIIRTLAPAIEPRMRILVYCSYLHTNKGIKYILVPLGLHLNNLLKCDRKVCFTPNTCCPCVPILRSF